MKAYTEEEVLNSLFTGSRTLALEGIEIKEHRKNAKEIYFTYKGKEFCLNKHNVILKFSIVEGKKWFQHGVLEFSDYKEHNEVLQALKDKLGR